MIIMDAIEFLAEWNERFEAEFAQHVHHSASSAAASAPTFVDQINVAFNNLPWYIVLLIAPIFVWVLWCLLEYATGDNKKPFYWPWKYKNRDMYEHDRFERENGITYDEMFKNKFSRK